MAQNLPMTVEPRISFAIGNKIVYVVNDNPNSKYIIDGYSFEGKKIYSFCEKYLPFKYDSKKDIEALLIEKTIYEGDLHVTTDSIYYINKRFGTIHKFSLDGKELCRINIAPILGVNENKKIQKNIEMFIDNKYIFADHNNRIAKYDVFLDSEVEGDFVYLLLDQHGIEKNAPINKIDIFKIDTCDYKLSARYYYPLEKKEWVSKLAVKSKDLEVFYVDIKSKERLDIISLKYDKK